MRTPHTTFTKNLKLIVIMRDGQRFIDRYVGKKSGVVLLKKLGRVSLKLIRVIGIYKGEE